MSNLVLDAQRQLVFKQQEQNLTDFCILEATKTKDQGIHYDISLHSISHSDLFLASNFIMAAVAGCTIHPVITKHDAKTHQGDDSKYQRV